METDGHIRLAEIEVLALVSNAPPILARHRGLFSFKTKPSRLCLSADDVCAARLACCFQIDYVLSVVTCYCCRKQAHERDCARTKKEAELVCIRQRA